MIIETFAVGMLGCNCTIIADEETREAIVIDPGDEPAEILKRLEARGLRAKQIICTHTHIDHVGGIHDLQARAETPAAIHKADLFLFEKLDEQARWLGAKAPKAGVIDQFLADGQAVTCKGVELGVIHTPGHTPGSSSFILRGDRDVLFTGDTLFFQSIGRTDLWGGDYNEIQASIRNRLLTFPDDTLVISGHGPNTTIGRERLTNPFLT